MLDGDRCPRPVPDAPVGAADRAALAKAWLLRLVAGEPLEQAADVPAAGISRDGPTVCAAVLDALGDDAALARVEDCGSRVVGGAWARDPAHAVRMVEALRRATWHALTHQAGDRDARFVEDLADRLGHVCGVLAHSAVAAAAVQPGPAPERSSDPAADPRDGFAPAAVHLRRASGEDDQEEGGAGAVAGMPESWQPPASEAPWTAAVRRAAERHGQDGRPFAVLTVEVDDLERLEAAAGGGEVEETLVAAEQALFAALGPGDAPARERPGRYWIVTREGGLLEGRMLAERIAAAVGASASPAGVPLTVSIGVAACPYDGTDGDTLLGRAEHGLWAARAAGLTLA